MPLDVYGTESEMEELTTSKKGSTLQRRERGYASTSKKGGGGGQVPPLQEGGSKKEEEGSAPPKTEGETSTMQKEDWRTAAPHARGTAAPPKEADERQHPSEGGDGKSSATQKDSRTAAQFILHFSFRLSIFSQFGSMFLFFLILNDMSCVQSCSVWRIMLPFSISFWRGAAFSLGWCFFLLCICQTCIFPSSVSTVYMTTTTIIIYGSNIITTQKGMGGKVARTKHHHYPNGGGENGSTTRQVEEERGVNSAPPQRRRTRRNGAPPQLTGRKAAPPQRRRRWHKETSTTQRKERETPHSTILFSFCHFTHDNTLPLPTQLRRVRVPPSRSTAQRRTKCRLSLCMFLRFFFLPPLFQFSIFPIFPIFSFFHFFVFFFHFFILNFIFSIFSFFLFFF